jgi:hypothetical protein
MIHSPKPPLFVGGVAKIFQGKYHKRDLEFDIHVTVHR